MSRNDHKKVLLQLSEAYQNVYKENTGKRYQVRSKKGLEAEFDELNDVEMYLASQLDRHGVDIDDWTQGDFAGDLRTPDMWEKDENGNLVLNVHEVYEVVDTQSADEYVEDAEHVFKNTEAGYEREKSKHKYSERVKAVNDAMDALVQFEKNIKHEDLDVEALAAAHEQLSRALHWLVDEKAVVYITGGRATERAAAGSRPEQFTSMEFSSDES